MKRLYLLLAGLAALAFATPATAQTPGQLCTTTGASAATLARCGVENTTGHVSLIKVTDGLLASNACTGGTDEMICFCEGTTCVPAADDSGLGVLPAGAVDWAEISDTMTLDADTSIGVATGMEFTINAPAQVGIDEVLSIVIDQADDADATDVLQGIRMELASESGDANDEIRGVVITVEEGTANTIVDAAILIDNEETTTATLTDAILVANTGAQATAITDGVDVSAAGIVNAVNIGDNLIMGTDDSLSVGATDDTVTLDSNDSAGVYTCTDADANAGCTFAGGGTGTATLGSTTNTQANIIGGQAYIDGGDTGNTDIVLRDFDAIAIDGDDNALIELDCQVVATGTEECDLDIQTQTDAGGGGDSALQSRIKLWAANDQMDITSETLILEGYTGGPQSIIFRDFDNADAEDSASIIMNCTDPLTTAEDCDFTFGVREAGGAIETRLHIDADGGVDIGSANVADVTLTSDLGTVTVNGDITIPDEPTGGNAGAVNEYIGVPRISMAAIGAMGNGPILSEPVVPTAALCAPVGGGAEADDAAVYRDTLVDVTSYRHTFVAVVGAGEGFDCDVTGHAVVGTTSVGFWFRSDTTFDAGDLEINLLDAAAVEGDGDLPAYAVADVWQWMEVDVTADCAATCADIDGVELLTTAQAPTNLNNAIVYMDQGAFWLAACEETLGADIQTDGVLSLLAGVTAGGDTTLLVPWTDYFVHYQTGNDAVCMITNQGANYGMVLYAY